MMETPFLDVHECAHYLKVAPATLYKWVHEGKIPYRKHLGKLVFHMNEIMAWSSAQAHPVITASQSKFQSAKDRIQLRSLKSEHTPASPDESQKGAG